MVGASYTGATTWWALPTQEQHTKTKEGKPLVALAAFIIIPLSAGDRLRDLPLLAVMQRLSYQGRDSYVCSTSSRTTTHRH